jgi:hypothetical protein
VKINRNISAKRKQKNKNKTLTKSRSSAEIYKMLAVVEGNLKQKIL